MKEIKAYVKLHMLSKVMMALSEIEGLSGMSIGKVTGFGRGRTGGAFRHASEGQNQVETETHAKIEVFCRDVLVERVVSAIEENAHTGLKGDGKIYVSPVSQAVRIRTGERGEEAI